LDHQHYRFRGSSFLIPVKGQTFVIRQIGGFVFQKTLSFQPSAISRSRTVEGFKVEELSEVPGPEPFNLRPSTFNSSSAPNGGFVPDSAKGRSFVINQIGGFVFQEALRFQPSAIS